VSSNTIIYVDDNHQSEIVKGYRLTDSELDWCVDQGYEYIIFVDPVDGRFVSTVDDWLDLAQDTDSGYHLARVYMTRS
jgi:hypothetical protein